MYVPIYITYYIYITVKIYFTIFYKKFNMEDHIELMFKTPIDNYRYSASLALFDIFIVSTSQNAFRINYFIFKKLYVHTRIKHILIYIIILFIIIPILSFVNITFIQIRLVLLLCYALWVDGLENFKQSFYKNIRATFTTNDVSSGMAIRVFDGFIKVNMLKILTDKKTTEAGIKVIGKCLLDAPITENKIKIVQHNGLIKDFKHFGSPIEKNNAILYEFTHGSVVDPLIKASICPVSGQNVILADSSNMLKMAKSINYSQKFEKKIQTAITLCKLRLTNDIDFLAEKNISKSGYLGIHDPELLENQIQKYKNGDQHKFFSEFLKDIKEEDIKYIINNAENGQTKDAFSILYEILKNNFPFK